MGPGQSGNPSCAEFDPSYKEVKFNYQNPSSGDSSDGPGSIVFEGIDSSDLTITLTDVYSSLDDVEGYFFDYSITYAPEASLALASIFVKQAAGGLYHDYATPVTQDQGLHPQGDDTSLENAVSHISFCFEASTPVPVPAADVSLSEICEPKGVEYSVTNTGETTIWWRLLDLDDDPVSTVGSGSLDVAAAVTDTETFDEGDSYNLQLQAFDNGDFAGDPIAQTSLSGIISCDGPEPDLSMTKTAREIDDQGQPGDEIATIDRGESFAYEIVVSNDGDGPATDLTVTDLVPAPLVVGNVEGCLTEMPIIIAAEVNGENGMQVGPCHIAEIEAEGSHTITIEVSVPGDAECDPVTNTAELYELDLRDVLVPQETEPDPLLTASATVRIESCEPVVVADPDISLTKTAVAIDGDDLIPGELVNLNGTKTFLINEDVVAPFEITYTFEIENTGEVTLFDVVLTDPMLGGQLDIDQDLSAGFAPGDVATASATYTLTDGDIAAVVLPNTATVTAVDEEQTEVSDTDTEVIEIVEVAGIVLAPDISVTKSAVDGVELDDDGNLVVEISGEGGTATVTYRMIVTNTGDDDLTDLTLDDDKIGDLTDALIAAVEDAYGSAVLPVDGSVTITADHEVTAADFDGITLTNVVDVEGTGVESGVTVADDDAETVTLSEVLDTAEALPRTGIDTAGIFGLGLLLALLGAAALLGTRLRDDELGDGQLS